ncbi:anti-sigma factor antagonist [Streptomyces sp. NPDC101213]|uniref:anti-sigma factor antagonist n=1 Tax=Streptomyces sp. NPDC101213 TaxID=3366130 RepID=UPI003806E04F
MAELAYGAGRGAGEDGPGAGGSGAPHTRPVPWVSLHARGDRVAVEIRGELDLDATEQLEHALRAALAAAAGAVDLDLGAVVFCDCAALNVLLELRERGLRQGKRVVVRSAAPEVERLLELTGTARLFADAEAETDIDSGTDAETGTGTGVGPRSADDALAPGPPQDPDGERNLRVEVVQLRRAMRTRPVIDLARGILMASFALSAQDAWRVLVDASQHTNTKLHHLARDLVGAVEGDPPPEAVREQVAAAVARIRSECPAGERGERADRVDG